MELRIRGEDSAMPPATRKPARRQPEPMPLLYRLVEHEGRDGPYVQVNRVWNNEDGARCRVCPSGTCNFIAEAGGVGTCWTRRDGKLADVRPTIASSG